ncbi:MAG: hypothetical protein H6734_04470 [Alphaproteobacteria bacterium]|nr:hypothetical protein [Alphaproteobacteria bacterium]
MILAAVLQLASAWEVRWSATTWEREADREGILTLGPGMPLRLAEEVVVTRADGTPVALRAGEDGWWIDPEPLTRYLLGPPGTPVAVVDERQWLADWAAWEHDAARALARADDVPAPPDGAGELAARVAARARGVGRSVALLGLLVDVAEHRGVSDDGRDQLVADAAYVVPAGETLVVEGRGLVRIGVRPISGGFERVEVAVEGESWEIASTGASSVYRRFLRAPGAPPLQVRGDIQQPVEVVVRRERLRRWLLLPAHQRRPAEGIAAVEWDALQGLPADFTPWLDDLDPAVATWARVRSIERASGAELLALCDPAVPGDPAVAHAVLRRAADLPIDVPLAWLETVEGPDPRVLADWLDGQQGTRPHGVALLERARRGRPADRPLARDEVRHAALATRWVGLEADRDAEATWRFAPDGLGVPRNRVEPGQTARFTVQTAHPDLRQAVRWVAAPGTRLTLDGREVAGEGELHHALAAGVHTVEVHEGALLTPTRGWEGGTPGVGWRAVPLPATFVLPGRGAPLDLRVAADGPVTLVFDDGRIERLEAGGEVRAGPYATSVRVEGDGSAGLAGRMLRVASEEPPEPDLEDALERIREATRQIDAGHPRARADRAVALAILGRRRLAWTDVAALAEVDPDLHREAWAHVATVPVLTRLEGPLDAATARAFGEPDAARALEALERGERDEAVVIASTAGEEVLRRALAGLAWVPVQRADAGGGLIPVELEGPPEREGVWAAVEDALVLSPWPADETVVVREGAVDRVVSPRRGLVLELHCRDLALRGAPCALEAFGTTTPGAVVSDGGDARVEVDGNVAEIGPVDPDQVVVVRASDAGGLVRAGVRRLGLAVRGRTAIRVPDDRLARIEVVSGDVRPVAPLLAEEDGRLVVHPRGQLVLQGSGTALVTLSEVRDEDDDLELERPARPMPTSLLTVDDLWPELARPSHRDVPRGPTWKAQMAGVVAYDGQYRERWTTAEIEVGAYRTEGRGWSFGEVWVRAPGGLGAVGEVGRRSGRSLVGLRGWGSTTFLGDAGEIGVQAHLRTQTGPKLAWLRAEIWPRLSWVSLQPRRVVDPRTWSRYRLVHYAGVDARMTVLSEPTRDLRMRVYAQADSNAGPSLDRMTLGSRADVLVARHLRLSAEGALDLVFKDLDRDAGRLTPRLAVSADFDAWWGPRRFLPFAEATASGIGDLSGQAGFSVHWTRFRGLRDPPPTRDLFRTAREGR